ncbi:hypothetical protein [Lacticaseibacillus sp. GG6-2]
MPMIDLRLHWLDVTTCVQLTATGKPSQPVGGGWFDVRENPLPAFVALPDLARLGGNIGDDFAVTGTTTTGYLASTQARDVFVRQQAATMFALVTLANAWSLHHLPPSKQATFNDLTRRFVLGAMPGDAWLASQQALLFAERTPSVPFAHFQAQLQATLGTLDTALAQVATKALIVVPRHVQSYQNSQMP